MKVEGLEICSASRSLAPRQTRSSRAASPLSPTFLLRDIQAFSCCQHLCISSTSYRCASRALSYVTATSLLREAEEACVDAACYQSCRRLCFLIKGLIASLSLRRNRCPARKITTGARECANWRGLIGEGEEIFSLR